MSFWTENYSEIGSVNNPKRNFRFKVTFTEFDKLTDYGSSDLFYAKTAEKPSFTLGEVKHQFLNHDFKFPGRVTWQDVNITMVDPGPKSGDPETSATGVASALTMLLAVSGYELPVGPSSDYMTISKTKAVSGIGNVIVTQLDHDGSAIEEWTLYNAFLADVNYGTLSYADDELTEYKITLRYDWASYTGIEFMPA